MTNPSELNAGIPVNRPGAEHRRRAFLLVSVLVWSLLVMLAFWWLLRASTGPSVWILRESDLTRPEVSQKLRGWFKADLGLQRIYPWILLGPYVALVAWYFPLERLKWRLHLALNLAACAAFIAASQWLDTQTKLHSGKVVFFDSQHQLAPHGLKGTNDVQIRIVKTESGDLFAGKVLASAIGATNANTLVPQPPELLQHTGDTNWLLRFHKDFDTPFSNGGPPKLRLLSILFDLLAYGAIVGFAHSVQFYRRLRERERQALTLESNLARARLDVLRAQLQPHFLFNSLNAIAALLRRDPRQAETALVALSELLRLSLSQSERAEVPFREEISLISRYLEIQQTRFGDRLRVEQAIEPAALNCLVPTLLLQPVVENAIRHGLEPADRPGLLRVSAARQGDRLALCVEDNGVGLLPATSLCGASSAELNEKHAGRANGTEQFPDLERLASRASAERVGSGQSTQGNGIGLKNLKARLETLYGAEHCLRLGQRPEGGAVVKIEIPWKLSTTG